jgi:group I intron endonuclease
MHINENKFNNSGIYKITNLKNSKVYIGSTNCFRIRFSRHKTELRNNIHNNSYLQNSWNKYGEESFIFEIVEMVVDLNSLREREQFWMDKLMSYERKNGYNILTSAYNAQGFRHSEETKAKISKLKLGKPMSMETRLKMSASKKGKPNNNIFTEEIRNKMRQAKLGKKLTESHKNKIAIANKGKIKSSKLSEDDVFNIKIMLRDEVLTHTEIASLFDVHSSNIKHISDDNSWQNIIINENDNLSNYFLIKTKEILNNREPKKNNKKLNKDDVKVIKMLLRDTSLYQSEIASLFNVGRKAITKINMNQRWNNVNLKHDDKLDLYYVNLAENIVMERGGYVGNSI